MVSSVDIIKDNAKQYFRDMGLEITDPSSFSKSFILQGGVSKYSNSNGPFSYDLRNGFSEAYNVAGNSETKNYGYRPMPGIQSVKVQTQGKLGSIKAAEIQIKVWDKAQLDIIDALYFKLGYTMFLEWGHTNYYDSDTGQLVSTEDYSIDPFEKGLTKEDIYNKISNNIRKLQGNYDAMLGVVTNFNFTYNQEGGYDCTLKMISLGVLISNMKMNNPRVLPDLQEQVVKRLVNTLTQLEKQRIAKEQAAAAAAAAAAAPPAEKKPQKVKADDFFNKYISYYPDRANKYSGGQVSLPSTSTESYATIDAAFNTEAYGWVYFIRKQKGFIPLDSKYLPSVKVTLDSAHLIKKFDTVKKGAGSGLSDPRVWNFPSNYLENAKDTLVKPVTSLVKFIIEGIPSFFSNTTVATGETELDKKNDTGEITINYPSTNGRNYNIRIKRKLWAVSDRQDIVDSFGAAKQGLTYTNSSFYYIDTPTFVTQLKNVLNTPQNTFTISNVDALPNETTTTITFTVPFTRSVKVNKSGTAAPDVTNPDGTVTKGKKSPDSIVDENVTFSLYVELSFNNSDEIKSFTVPAEVIEPIEFVGTSSPAGPNTGPAVGAAQVEPPTPTLQVSDVQKTETEKYRSAFEVMIRVLQLYSLDQSISQGIENDHKVKELKLLDKKVFSEFTKKLFDSGLFSSMLNDLITLSKEASTKDPSGYVVDRCLAYDENIRTGTFADKEEMMLIRALFGFHFGLLGNTATASYLLKGNLAVDYDYLMRTYTVPYEFNQGIFQGSQLNHPVYVPLGLVIMILNHMCTMYDDNKPIVYLDFNHKSNLCLSNAKHLSTNPYDILIPFQGTNEDFVSILEPSTVGIREESDSKTKKVISSKLVIKAVSGSSETPPVYTPINESDSKDAIRDRISGGLMLFKTGESVQESYRGRTMNILISCDYLLRIVGNFSKSNGSGDVYVREFLEQILSDINKSLGDINVFRFAYDDNANAAHIVDDQMTPNLEERYLKAIPDEKDVSNRSRLPLFGNGSIARNLEIRTEISSKLSNMVAISANANIEDQSNLSKSTEAFGLYNTAYKDRYIPTRTEFTSSIVLPTDTMIRSTLQFNEAIKTFYGDATPAEGSVGHATNYYIQRMSKIKSSEKGTRAAAMIPVSLNFSIDGMSGFGMGQSFTIDPEFLPYSYNLKLTDPYGEKDFSRTVAFVMVGLDHTIEGNQWVSSVRSNMIYSKDQSDFNADKLKALKVASGLTRSIPVSGGGGGFGGSTYINTGLKADKIIVGPVTKEVKSFEEVTKQVIANLESGYYHPVMLEDGRVKGDKEKNKKVLGTSGETMFGIDRLRGGSINTTAAGSAFWKLIDEADAKNKWPHYFIPKDPLKTELLNLAVQVMKPQFESLFSKYVTVKEVQDLVRSDGRLYFNFIYATWNGPGYFQNFSQQIIKAYNGGQRSAEQLLKVFIDLRLNTRIFYPNTDDNSFNLMKKGGVKIAGLVGVQLA